MRRRPEKTAEISSRRQKTCYQGCQGEDRSCWCYKLWITPSWSLFCSWSADVQCLRWYLPRSQRTLILCNLCGLSLECTRQVFWVELLPALTFRVSTAAFKVWVKQKPQHVRADLETSETPAPIDTAKVWFLTFLPSANECLTLYVYRCEYWLVILLTPFTATVGVGRCGAVLSMWIGCSLRMLDCLVQHEHIVVGLQHNSWWPDPADGAGNNCRTERLAKIFNEWFTFHFFWLHKAIFASRWRNETIEHRWQFEDRSLGWPFHGGLYSHFTNHNHPPKKLWELPVVR